MPWWESGLFWGVVGFLISTIYYFVGKERILMKHHTTIRQITPEEIADMPEISIHKPIYLSETTIKFTNSGNRTIEPSNYAAKEPLGVHFSGHLYRHKGFAENKNSIPDITSIGDNKYKIDFDFLKPKQSFSIQLLHDGIIAVIGELRSGKSIDLGHTYIVNDYMRKSYLHSGNSNIDYIDSDEYFDLFYMDLADTHDEIYHSLDLEGVDSEGVDSEGVDSEGVDLEGVDSEGVDSEGVDSEGVDLVICNSSVKYNRIVAERKLPKLKRKARRILLRITPIVVSIIFFIISLVYSESTFKPIFSGVSGIIWGILAANFLFGVKGFFKNFYINFKHKGRGV